MSKEGLKICDYIHIQIVDSKTGKICGDNEKIIESEDKKQ